MTATFNQGWLDRSGEQSSSQFHIQDAGGDDYTTAIATAAIVASALEAVSLCTALNRTLSIQVATNTPDLPASPYAQREMALKVFYSDNVNAKKYSFTVPGPDLTLLAQANTDEVDIVSNVAAAALKTALDASLASPDGNAVTVYRMRVIGRAS